MFKSSLPLFLIFAGFAGGFVSTPAVGQTASPAIVEVEIDRDITELQPVLRPEPDVDSTDTALVFNNPRGHRVSVHCAAFDHNGNAIGRIRLRIPARGVRLAFASDMANGADFIGSAACRTTGRVIPTAFIVGSGLTDTKAQVVNSWETNWIRFPVIASF